jgi:predicted ArsR family transcriptional regulator
MDPVRRQVFDFVAHEGGEVSRDQTAEAVGIGRSLAAFHLDKLAAAGVLATTYRRPAGKTGPGAGRPAKLYRWSGDAVAVSFPARNYELIGRFLVEALGRRPATATLAEARRLAAAAGRALGARNRPELEQDRDKALSALLADQGFRPRSGPAGIRLENCPFRSWADLDQRAVCKTNAAFQRGILAGLEIADRRVAVDRKPDCCCIVIKERSDN